MIAASIRGGLGNQMFEYAAGRSLALRHDTDLLLDLSELGVSTTPRVSELGCFAIAARPVQRVRSHEPAPPGSSRRVRLGTWRRAAGSEFRVLRQKGFSFQPAFFSAPDRTHLVGYWQSERYFAEHADAIRRDFVIERTAAGDGTARLLEAIASTTSLSVHVRRGDYADDPIARGYHGLLPTDYYRAAVATVAARVIDVRGFVFSDDLAWCRSHLDLPIPMTFVDVRAAPSVDLLLMSRCAHHVIANSSFSWWGAWLGEAAPGTIVIAPRRWVQDGRIDTSHVVPDRWLRV